MQNSPVDERDTLIDAIDALENEPCDEVAGAAARLARRYLKGIADLTDREQELLTAAAEQDSSRFATTGPSRASETCSLALAGFFALWLRIRETR